MLVYIVVYDKSSYRISEKLFSDIAAFIDAEHALDPVYAKNIGVDIDNLYISQPDNGEQALEIADTMVRSGAIDVIVIDSVAALVPKAELEGSTDSLALFVVEFPGAAGKIDLLFHVEILS